MNTPTSVMAQQMLPSTLPEANLLDHQEGDMGDKTVIYGVTPCHPDANFASMKQYTRHICSTTPYHYETVLAV